MILISYPAGGFGNFLYHALTEFSSNTYKPTNQNFKFDSAGRSHSTKKYTPIYFHDPKNYQLSVPETDLECIVLCDNGIHNDSYTQINQIFPGATIVRCVISENVKPIVYKTCIIKAKKSNVLEENINQVADHWDNQEDYSIRENFTLLYHNWPFAWLNEKQCINVDLEKLITDPVTTIEQIITSIGGQVIDKELLETTSKEWVAANKKYFDIYYQWQQIEQALDTAIHIDIQYITDLHDQGYINYCIERKYNVTIPVYNYRDWFRSTNEIQIMLKNV